MAGRSTLAGVAAGLAVSQGMSEETVAVGRLTDALRHGAVPTAALSIEEEWDRYHPEDVENALRIVHGR